MIPPTNEQMVTHLFLLKTDVAPSVNRHLLKIFLHFLFLLFTFNFVSGEKEIIHKIFKTSLISISFIKCVMFYHADNKSLELNSK